MSKQAIAYTRLTDVPGRVRPSTGRVRFDRADGHAAIMAASRASTGHGRSVYVYPTAYGWTLEFTQPPSWLSHYRVSGRMVENYLFDTGAPD